MARKLKKSEAMLVSKVLKDINFKYYVSNMLSTGKLDSILAKGSDRKEKMALAFADIIAFVLENMSLAEENLDLLVKSYKACTLETVQDMDFEDYVACLKEIFKSGVPKVLNDYVDLTGFKKKLQDMKKSSQEETEH